jgi:hypothetical protein
MKSVYSFAFIEAYRAVLDLTEIRSDWGVAQGEAGREAHVLRCGGKGAENSPQSRRFLPPFSQVTETILV